MNGLQIPAFYTAVFLLFFMILSLLVIRLRNVHKVKLGDGDAPCLHQAIRAHGNFCENTPLALLGLWGLAALGASNLWLHSLGACLFVARTLHAWGLMRSQGRSFGRMCGVLLTWLALSGEGVLLLLFSFS